MIFRVSCLPKCAGDPTLTPIEAGRKMTKALSSLMHKAMEEFPKVVRLPKGDDVTVLFPVDMLEEGLGTEVVIETIGYDNWGVDVSGKVTKIAFQITRDFINENLPQCKLLKLINLPDDYMGWVEYRSWKRTASDKWRSLSSS